VLDLLSSIQVLGGILLSIGSCFQLVKLFRIEESRDFSLPWVWLAFVGISLMEIYALGIFILLGTWGFLVSNSAALLLQLATLILVLRYKN